MRIISGIYKGRKINAYQMPGTRPTMDRVKESVFAMLQGCFKGACCLDLFAGSGALGLEAISNGARSCYFVDQNPVAIHTLKETIASISVKEDCILWNMDYQEALKRMVKQNIKFDCVFLDPPYQEHILEEILLFLFTNHMIHCGGYIVCEYDGKQTLDSPFSLWKIKKYGNKNVAIFQNSCE